MRPLLLVGFALLAAGLAMFAGASMAGAGPGDPGACDRHPEDPRCATSTTSSTTTLPGTTTTTLPGSTTTRPPSTGGTIGGAGCSTSRNAVNGYTQESTVDRIANPTGTQWGRGVLEKWSDPTHPDYPSLWSVYESLRPAGGYGEVLILNCLHNSEHDGAVTSALQAKALALVNEVWARDPGVPIWYGAKPIYPPGAVCNLTGPQGDVVANELADWVANLDPNDLIYRAPVLGPLTSNMTTDGCHLSAAGRAFTGQQLVAFFD